MKLSFSSVIRGIGVFIILNFQGLANITYGQTLPAEAFFTLRDLGSDGTVDEVDDTPPVIGQASFRGSISHFSEYTDESFVEFNVQGMGVADQATLNVSISNLSPQGSPGTVKTSSYAGMGSTDVSLYQSSGTPMVPLDVPAAPLGSFCCSLSVDVTHAYNNLILAGKPFLGFRFHDPSWASDPSQGQVFLNDASLVVNLSPQQPEVVKLRFMGLHRPINTKSQGTISVAIVSSSEFDARRISVPTIRFGPTGAEAAPTLAVIADANRDGKDDLILHFSLKDTSIECGTTTLVLTGKSRSGSVLQGIADFHEVGCKP